MHYYTRGRICKNVITGGILILIFLLASCASFPAAEVNTKLSSSNQIIIWSRENMVIEDSVDTSMLPPEYATATEEVTAGLIQINLRCNSRFYYSLSWC